LYTEIYFGLVSASEFLLRTFLTILSSNLLEGLSALTSLTYIALLHLEESLLSDVPDLLVSPHLEEALLSDVPDLLVNPYLLTTPYLLTWKRRSSLTSLTSL
jgi:hypothetical protein